MLRLALLGAALAATALLAACGSSDGASDAGGPAGEPPSAAPSTGPTEGGDAGDVRSALPWVDVPTVVATLTGPDGGLLEWCLLLAATGEDRSRGLMDAPDAELGGYDGMLFAWDEDVSGRFHMLDTEVPLSIAWFAADGSFVSATDMDPCPTDVRPCPTFGASGPYRHAVEVAQGVFAEAGVGEGWQLEVTDRACAPA